MSCSLTCDSLVLGIETSCDETAAAVVRGGREILSNVVASQDELHAPFGGVVPEVASRRHAELVTLVVNQALGEAGVGWSDLSLVAVTRGPGLIGSLLVGTSAAKGYALATGLPLVGVNHIAAHLASAFLTGPRIDRPAPDDFPALGLVASGGHSDLVLMSELGKYRLVGWTRDDAAGEALDKAARLLGLGYPGGPAIERAAAGGNPAAVPLPRPDTREGLQFSFAGLKTALVRVVEPSGLEGCGYSVPDLAASFQQAVVDSLVRETMQAAALYGVRQVVVTGGVAANSRLREDLAAAAAQAGIPVHFPPKFLCTDNAAMVAAAGFIAAQRGQCDDLNMEVDSALQLSTEG